MARYAIRKQDDGLYCVWDTETDSPAEAHDFRYVNLRWDEAEEARDELNQSN
jgi:hypothetical protein